MEYTKGPWEIYPKNNSLSIIAKGKTKDKVGDVIVAFVGEKKNLRLIAAAPDLYEALKAIEYDGEPGEICCPYCETHLGKGHDKNCVIGNALRKAEGRGTE